ncbi:excalibur calcium-binding domain-containing protein [Tessaracoccus sp. ZS01]|nr:hypothetical protein [Tessaracoccus sp. ZS01]
MWGSAARSAERSGDVAPRRAAVPGYRTAMDRDGDGVACERRLLNP